MSAQGTPHYCCKEMTFFFFFGSSTIFGGPLFDEKKKIKSYNFALQLLLKIFWGPRAVRAWYSCGSGKSTKFVYLRKYAKYFIVLRKKKK